MAALKTVSPSGAVAGGPRPYRADIDCLRAIAVLLVIGFHWRLGGFRGGFVGVDVFFVISGYLIARLISDGLFDGTFSFADFYVRRARRLLPALYATIFLTAIAGWFVLLPPALHDLGRSALSVFVFSSNILFWRETGYFDAPAVEKPLLHTWSLSVEEQFYLVVPALLWFLIRTFRQRRSVIVVVLTVLAALSFALSCWQTARQPSAAFYLSPPRAWEFLAGSSLVLLERWPGGRLLRGAALGLGGALIAAAAFGFGPTTPFPGPAALVPCLGTALVVWAHGRAASRPSTAIVGASAFVGRISYALYLWHWPIYVLVRAYVDASGDASWGAEDDLTNGTKAGLFGATVALSLLSYVAIEKPLRTRRRLPGNTAFAAACALATAAFAGLVGLAQVVPFLTGHSGAEAARIAGVASGYPYQALFREGTCFLRPDQSFAEYDRSTCFSVDPRRGNVLLWGDSMAAHYMPGLGAFAARRGLNLLQATASICPPMFGVEIEGRPHCRDFNDRIGRLILDHPGIVVVVSADWSSYEAVFGAERLFESLRRTLKRLQGHGIRVIVFGPPIKWRQELPAALARRVERNLLPIDSRSLFLDSQFLLDERLRAALPDVPYISILDAACPSRRCPAFVGGVPAAFDKNHLTREASIMVIDAIAPELERDLH